MALPFAFKLNPVERHRNGSIETHEKHTCDCWTNRFRPYFSDHERIRDMKDIKIN